MPMKEPRPASYFRLTLGGHEAVGVFKEASGFDSESEVIEHVATDANGHPFKRKVVGNEKWSNIVLKRGVDESLDIWKWRDMVVKEGADKARVDGKIELLAIDSPESPIATYQFKQGWPIKYVAATLDASTNNVALEELHICHEGFERMPA
jgi:phage tail-like protein